MTASGVTPMIGTRSRGPEYLMLEKHLADALLQARLLGRMARDEDEVAWLQQVKADVDALLWRVRAAIQGDGRHVQVEGLRPGGGS